MVNEQIHPEFSLLISPKTHVIFYGVVKDEF